MSVKRNERGNTLVCVLVCYECRVNAIKSESEWDSYSFHLTHLRGMC